MRFLTFEECSDSELRCIYHDPERTITILHPRTSCSLQLYAPEEDNHITVGTFHTRRPNNVHSWWLQRLGVAGSQLLGVAHGVVQSAITTVKNARYHDPDKNRVRYRLEHLLPIIPHHEALDDEEHIRDIQPLPSPWSWPPNTYYREVHRGYTEFLTESLISELITDGILLANEFGIRWKHLDQQILLRIENSESDRANRPRLEQLDAPAFRRAIIGRAGTDAENGDDDESPGTPIVEADGSLSIAEKKVRLGAKSINILPGGSALVENVEDNEGKTVLNKVIRAGVMRKQRRRSTIRWDSDCGF